MLSHEYNIIDDCGAGSLGHDKEVVYCFNATEQEVPIVVIY